MPKVGDIEYKYGRVYIYTQPNASKGPGTWRPSNPDAIAGPGGGGSGTGVAYDFDAVPPIVVDTKPGVGGNPNVVETSMDLKILDDRTK